MVEILYRNRGKWWIFELLTVDWYEKFMNINGLDEKFTLNF